MPVDTVRSTTSQTKPVVPRSQPKQSVSRTGGFLAVHPRHEAELAAYGLRTADDFLTLAGEIVSGHPDRHVVQVRLSGHDGTTRIAYLKRQHIVRWKERLQNAIAGFGRVSKSAREAVMLAQLETVGFVVPEWMAYGESVDGRAFLLVAEVPGVVELRTFLGDPKTTPEQRTRIAERIGQTLAELHSAGFHYPDSTAKHFLINPQTLAITLIDWQTARRFEHVSERLRHSSLAVLYASIAENLATAGECARVLWSYRQVLGHSKQQVRCTFSSEVKAITRLADSVRNRRSLRDQRMGATSAQRLVWLAGEAACVVPELADSWPNPADGEPFYSDKPAHFLCMDTIDISNGQRCCLVRDRSSAPLSRLIARLRGKLYRSQGLVLSRVLFHLDRYGVPVPRILAFGQKLTTQRHTESFVLFEPPQGSLTLKDWYRTPTTSESRSRILETTGLLLRQLHEAGCRLDLPFAEEPCFHVTERDPLTPVVLGAVRSVRLVRRSSERGQLRDVCRLLQGPLGFLNAPSRLSLLRGYFGSRWSEERIMAWDRMNLT